MILLVLQKLNQKAIQPKGSALNSCVENLEVHKMQAGISFRSCGLPAI